MATRDLEIILKVRDDATAKLENLKGTVGKMAPVFGAMAAAGTAAFAGITAVAYKSIQSANESAKAQAQLGAVLKSTGQIAGITAQAATELAASLQKTTTFSDEAVLSAENLLLTFTGIGKDIFPQATKTVLDMATALGTDTSSAAIQLGKALQDPILGVTTLRRVGVNFNQDQQDLIKTMVESGKTMEAQQYILAELAKEFGGSASAQASTFEGHMKMVANQIDDVQENIGNALLPALEKMLAAVVPIVQKMAEWSSKNPELTAKVVEWGIGITGAVAALGTMGLILPKIITAINLLITGLTFLAANPIIVFLGTLATSLIAVYNAATKMQEALNGAADAADISDKVLASARSKFMTMPEGEAKNKLGATITSLAKSNEEVKGMPTGGLSGLAFGFTSMLGDIFNRGQQVLSSGHAGALQPAPQYSFTFNGDVIDPDKLVGQVTSALNRQSLLKSTSGL